VEIVANLKRQPMSTGRQLHVDDVFTIAKVHPWRGAGNRRARRQTVSINRDVVMAQVGPGLGDRARRDRCDRKVLGPEFQTNRALDGGAVGRLHEEHPTPALTLRLSARAERERHDSYGRNLRNGRYPHSAREFTPAARSAV
jgi:hypothetical protein